MKIPFSEGEIKSYGESYYTLNLYDKSLNKVYSATIDKPEMVRILEKYNNIKFV